MRILAISILILAAGGAAAADFTAHQLSDDTDVPDLNTKGEFNRNLVSNSLEGAWNGEIELIAPTNLLFEDDKPMEVMLLNCDGSVEIWTKIEGASFSRSYGEFEILSLLGNHLLSKMGSGTGWVETQSWGIIFLNTNRMYVHWNRMVSNPFAGIEDEKRYFGQFGAGELQRISMDCDVWKDKDPADNEE